MRKHKNKCALCSVDITCWLWRGCYPSTYRRAVPWNESRPLTFAALLPRVKEEHAPALLSTARHGIPVSQQTVETPMPLDKRSTSCQSWSNRSGSDCGSDTVEGHRPDTCCCGNLKPEPKAAVKGTFLHQQWIEYILQSNGPSEVLSASVAMATAGAPQVRLPVWVKRGEELNGLDANRPVPAPDPQHSIQPPHGVWVKDDPRRSWGLLLEDAFSSFDTWTAPLTAPPCCVWSFKNTNS